MADISVLLTVRDWDLTRVEMCLRSLLRSEHPEFQIVLLDYGSRNSKGIRELAEQYAVTFKREEATEWSRSKAMNAAAALAKGRHLIFADADLVFSPTVLSETVARLDSNPNCVLLFQFRDLPSGITADQLLDQPNFIALDQMSVWRPRWGMGVQAYTRAAFNEIRGFDERMKIYGGEDNDIAKRARGNGYRLEWVTGLEFGLYHVWHPSSREAADSNKETKAELEKNVQIAKHDHSKVRNLDSWRGAAPLVSVVITTYNRADYIRDSIVSVLNQTCQDFEILVMDDGSDDHTKSVVESMTDTRIRYYQCDKQGIPSLRNRALDLSRGEYTAIHDDDDIMLPWSLETRLSTLVPGALGAYGGAINFDNDSGEFDLFPGREAELASVLNGSKVFYHAALLVNTDLLRAVKYDESFQSGSDFNLALRLMKVGAKLLHCGDVVLLRRLHRRQVTVVDKSVQHGASYASSFAQRAALGAGSRAKSQERSKEIGNWKYRDDLVSESRFAPYLPSHLVSRSLLVLEPTSTTDATDGISGEILTTDGPAQLRFIRDVSTTDIREADGLRAGLTGSHVVRIGEEFELADSVKWAIEDMFDGCRFVAINPQHVERGFLVCPGVSPEEVLGIVAADSTRALFVELSHGHSPADLFESFGVSRQLAESV